ncbi:hypothetical protein B0J17DRAFT_719363 [Rhizoctonia solani]|nr:hypothetical protein B0J17DRAFT_719363 [Rhizoctonia solani]
MELGSGSNCEPEAASANDNETTKAQKVIYRGIWNGIKAALNATVAGALHGQILWKDTTSEQRNAVRLEILENHLYLRRFQGGWIEELIMMTQLSKRRDTVKHKRKKATESQLKPLERLSKKSYNQTKKRSLESHKSQATAPPTTAQSGGSAPSQSGNSANTSGSQPTNAPSDKGKKSTNDQASSVLEVSDTGEQTNTLPLYFKPMPTLQRASTSNKKHLGADDGDHDMEAGGDRSESNDEDWSRAVDDEIANSKSKKQNEVASMSLSAAKDTSTAPEDSTAKTLRPKARPKPRPPPSDSTGEETVTELFHRTTQAAKQKMINDAEAETEARGKNKGKSSTKNKRSVGNKKEAVK